MPAEGAPHAPPPTAGRWGVFLGRGRKAPPPPPPPNPPHCSTLHCATSGRIARSRAFPVRRKVKNNNITKNN